MKKAATKKRSPTLAPQTGVRWTPEDLRILEALRAKLGVSVIQIVRVALRALALKEKVLK